MDEIDRRLIIDLETYGFQKASSLANAYGLSERTIRRRISNMTNKKLINFVVTPNIVSLGYKAWARIGIKVAIGDVSRVARALILHPSVHFVAYSLGRYDIMISVCFDTIDKLTYFVGWELNQIQGIVSTEVILLVQPRKYMLFSWQAPVMKNNKKPLEPLPVNMHNQTSTICDEIDLKILNYLLENGPGRSKILSSELGIGESAVRNRLRRMWQNDIYKVEIVPNIAVAEYQTQAQILINTSGVPPHSVVDSILKHPSVYLASVCLGRFNLVIAARFRNPDVLEEFITNTLPSVHGINSVETSLQVKRVKYYRITWPVP